MAITNILVPFDGSTFSIKAFKAALSIAENNNAKVKVLTCLEKEDVGAWYIDKRTNKEIMKDAKKFASGFLVKLEKIAEKTSIPVSFKILETKDISKQIISYADSNKINLIVIGSHGKTGFNRLLLGSVSNKVSQIAKCPVLIVK